MKNKRLLNCCYIIILMATILLIFYVDFIADYDILNVNLILYILFPAALYKVLKQKGIDNAFFWAASSFIVLVPILLFFSSKRVSNEINQYGGTIITAIITDKQNLKYNNAHIRGYYITTHGIKCGFWANNSEVYKLKTIGDTIAIVYSNKNVERYKIYKWFPTHEEIQKYKNGKLYEPKKAEANQ